MAQFLASGRSKSFGAAKQELSIVELIADFCECAKEYYGTGRNSELYRNKAACKPLLELYRSFHAAEFGPHEFKCMRERMVDIGWARSTNRFNPSQWADSLRGI